MISRIITIDQSTSATKAMLFSEDCELLHRVNIEHQQFYPQIGWVEHDAEEIYKNTIEAIHCLLEQEEVNGKDISYSIAITKRWLFGTDIPASPFIMPWYGNASGERLFAKN